MSQMKMVWWTAKTDDIKSDKGQGSGQEVMGS